MGGNVETSVCCKYPTEKVKKHREKNFKCSECGKCFYKYKDLTRHFTLVKDLSVVRHVQNGLVIIQL